MKTNNIYILEDRGILYINGKDSKTFLQNIISNDIEKVNINSSIFSSLLTPQGKYLFDFLVLNHKDGFLLDCEKKQVDELFKKLNSYKLRSEVEILNLTNEFTVACISLEKFASFKNSNFEEGHTIRFREDALFVDPRSSKLGARLVINLEKLYLSIKKLNLKPCDQSEYYALSHNLGIPQINSNNLQDKIFGIECNFEELNGIDFKKGCYVGQENTARIKLKNKLSNRLFAFKILKGKIEIGDDIFYKNQKIGKVLINETYPFGSVKIKNHNFDFTSDYSCKNATIKFFKPSWIT